MGKNSPCTLWGPQRALLQSCHRVECDKATILSQLFELTLQPVLEQVDAVCEEAPLVSYLDEMNTVGKLTPAACAFRRLCVDDDKVGIKGLEPRLPKCGIYGGDMELVAAEAAKGTARDKEGRWRLPFRHSVKLRHQHHPRGSATLPGSVAHPEGPLGLS